MRQVSRPSLPCRLRDQSAGVDLIQEAKYLPGMLRPLFAVVLLIATISGGVKYAESRLIFTDWNGHPLDYPGDRVPCTRCQEPLVHNVRGYHYRCHRCHRCDAEFDCRLREDRRFRYDPDLRLRPTD